MAKVDLKESDSIENALKRFKREVALSGNLKEARKRTYYEKPSVIRKNKKNNKKKF